MDAMQPEESRLMRERDIRWFLSGRLVSEIGSRISREGLPITAILTLGTGPIGLSLMAAATQLPGLLLSAQAGAFTDRMRRRPLLIAMDAARFLLLLAVPVLAFLHHLALWQLVGVSLLVAGIGFAYQIADQAYLPALVGRDRLEAGNRLVYAAGAVGETAGPTVMGALVQGLGAPLAILFDAVSYLVSALTILAIRRPEPALRAAAEDEPLPRATQGLRVVLRHPLLRPLALVAAVSSLFGGAFAALYELYALRTLHLMPLSLGILVTLGGIGSLISAGISRQVVERLGIGRSLTFSLFASGVVGLLIPIAGGGPVLAFAALAAAQLLGDLSGTIYEIHETVLRQTLTPDHWLGRVNGGMQFFAGLCGLLGTLGFGLLALAAGVRSTFWVAALGDLLLSIWFLRSRVAALGTTPPADEAAFREA
jgi:MFS family permease